MGMSSLVQSSLISMIQNGEVWAIGTFTLTGRDPERPCYKTTDKNTWPSKLRNWKHSKDCVRRKTSIWVNADKEFHIDEACKSMMTHHRGIDESLIMSN